MAGYLLDTNQVDMMQAALARQMRLTLLTADRDFNALPELPTENWLPNAGG
jgi:predicted nucleic acid-binding protein